ncbi:hypothetical protein DL93DRAFT_2076522 [Clavulina sp. PMI_390]|nr:hypothetical protein DL93DRAFT_2076522 [Clavulina sp. PMI_390]
MNPSTLRAVCSPTAAKREQTSQPTASAYPVSPRPPRSVLGCRYARAQMLHRATAQNFMLCPYARTVALLAPGLLIFVWLGFTQIESLSRRSIEARSP